MARPPGKLFKERLHINILKFNVICNQHAETSSVPGCPTFFSAVLGTCRQRVDHPQTGSRVAKPEADALQTNTPQTPHMSRGTQQTSLNLCLLHSDHQTKPINAGFYTTSVPLCSTDQKSTNVCTNTLPQTTCS